MRQNLLLLIMLVSLLTAPALAKTLTLHANIGYDGYYRLGTLVPIVVEVINDGGTLQGEFFVRSKDEPGKNHTFRTAFTIPKNSKRTVTLYASAVPGNNGLYEVGFQRRGRVVAETEITRSQQLYDADRLVVVVGGTGASLRYLNGQGMTVGPSMPRGWDFTGHQMAKMSSAYASPGGAPPQGQIRLVNLVADQLPDNPEAYGSIGMLVLMPDNTENVLTAGAQRAITSWVVSGGHVLFAGGGVQSRFASSFFRTLMSPLDGTASTRRIEKFSAADLGDVVTARVGAGRVSVMSGNPDAVTTDQWQQASLAYANLAAREPRIALGASMIDALGRAVAVRHLRPPSLALIVGYLMSYLLVLLPVNFFVLKKMDKRELAWLTTPIIVLVFTIGAYGIGYVSKGHRLVANAVTLMEIIPEQREGEAISQLLIFSPSRTSYRLSLGDGAVLAQEISDQQMTGYPSRQSSVTSPLSYSTLGDALAVDRVLVNMWDFRRFATAHRVDLQEGITSQLTVATAAGGMPAVSGTLTNGTSLQLSMCALYVDGVLVEKFALAAGSTVTLGGHAATSTSTSASFGNTQLNHMYQVMQGTRNGVPTMFNPGQPLANGMVLVGYTDNLHLPIALDRHPVDTQLGVVVVHLN